MSASSARTIAVSAVTILPQSTEGLVYAVYAVMLTLLGGLVWLLRRGRPRSLRGLRTVEAVLFAARADSHDAAQWGIERMRIALGVDQDLRAFHERFRHDPLIGRAIRSNPALRAPGRPDPFEALIWAICEESTWTYPAHHTSLADIHNPYIDLGAAMTAFDLAELYPLVGALLPAGDARGRGQVTLAGAVGDPPHGAVIVFEGVPPDEIDAFARQDPYMQAGLIEDYRIERWNLV